MLRCEVCGAEEYDDALLMTQSVCSLCFIEWLGKANNTRFEELSRLAFAENMSLWDYLRLRGARIRK